MALLRNWSELPAKRRHFYVYVGLLAFALCGNVIKASFASKSHHTNEKSVKQDVVKFLGIDELPQIEPGTQWLLDSSRAK